MNKIKKSKFVYNCMDMNNDKCYLIFTFFNTNLSIINLLKMIIEDDLGLKISFSKENSKFILVYVEIDFKNYIEYKEDLIDFFINEDFKFCFSSVYYKKNYLEPIFFEEEFLKDFDEFLTMDELLERCYMLTLDNLFENSKIIFFLYSLLLCNKTLINYNVYNTSSSL